MRLRSIFLLIFCLTGALHLQAQNVTVTGALVGNGSYATLGAAFAAINGGAQTGATIFVNIVGNTNEGATSAVLNAGAWTSLTVRPQGGAARAVLGATTPGQGLIHLNGADYVNILGLNSGGNSLTIENTTVSDVDGTSTVLFSNDASQNTLNRCNVRGSSRSYGNPAATVLMGWVGPSTGNDNNTISLCNIGPSGTNLHAIAVFSQGNSTAPSRFSNGNILTECNIFDYFHPSYGSHGLYLHYGNRSWQISYNRFYQTGVRTQTSPSTHNAITVSGVYYPTGGNDGHGFNGNYIGGSNSSGTGTYSIVGAGTGTSVNGICILSSEVSYNLTHIYNNTISNISVSGPIAGTGSYSVFAGIRVLDGVPRIGYAGGNTIGSLTNPNSIVVSSTSTAPMEVYGIYSVVNTSVYHFNNKVGGITASNSNTGYVYLGGIYSRWGITDIKTNEVGFAAAPLQLIANNPACAMAGITIQTDNVYCHENTVRSLVSTAPSQGTGSSAGLIGIRVSATGAQPLVHQNNIFSLSNTHPTAAVSVTGLVMIGIAGNPIGDLITNNIHSIEVASSNPGSKLTGMLIVSGNYTVANNFIRLGYRSNGAAITTGLQMEGIREAAGSSTIFHNSVYLGGTSVSDTATTYAFVSTSTQGIRRYYNNIFDNARSNGALGSGKHFAIGLSGANYQLAGLESDHNVLYAPGVGGKVGKYKSFDVESVSVWQLHTAQELNSVLWNPGFILPTGNATTGNLRISTGPTPVEARGTSAVTRYEDFDNQGRSTLTPVDIGADAGLFIAANTGPEINVKGAGLTVFDGDSIPRLLDGTDFDSVSACLGTAMRSFTIENKGTDTLTISGISFGGVNAADFSVTQNPPSILVPGGTGNFQVAFTPSAMGMRQAWIHLTNDDFDEAIYDFVVQGLGSPDTIRPVAACQAQTLYLDTAGQTTLTPTQLDGGSTDNCGVDSIAADQTTFNCSQAGLQSITLSVWDANGNLDTCMAAITVADTSAPLALCQSFTLQLDSNGQAILSVNQLDAGSIDNCGVDSLAASQQLFDCSHAGANLVTLRVWDFAGNLDSCTATVTITESTSPQAACQSITLALDSTGQASIIPGQLDSGSTDNCGIDSTALSQTMFDCSDVGVIPVVLSVWDQVGNVDTCLAMVTIADTSSPVAACQALALYLDTAGQATLTATQLDGGSTDNCGVDSFAANISAFNCNQIGQQSITLSVWDANGNLDTCMAAITVADTSAPLALCQSFTLQLDSSGQASLTVNQLDAGSADNCGVDSLAASQQLFDCSDAGANQVTLRVWDAAGNLDSCTAIVTITESTPPQAACQSISLTLDSTGQATIIPSQLDAGSTDNCGIDSLALDQTIFDCSDVGLNPVVLSVWDVVGNVDTCIAMVTIADTSSPVAACQALTLYLDTAGQATLTATQLDGGSTDNCGVDSIAADQTTFNCSQAGLQSITLSVWDANGNLDTCMAAITVADTSAPLALCQSFTLQLDSSGQAILTLIQLDAGSTDNCGVDSLAASQQLFDCSDAGANQVTLRVWDTAGNLDSCTTTVTITESTPPHASCQSITLTLDSTGQASIIPGQLDAGSSDNCGIDSMALDKTVFDCSDVGMNPVVLSVWDASGNVDTCHATVSIPIVPMSITLQADSFSCGHAIRCAGDANGRMQVLVTGGCPPLTYQWSNGATTASVDSHVAGTYTVTVTDGTGFFLQATRSLTAPAPLTVATQLLDIPCQGATDGAAEAIFQGGNACNGYAVVWSNGATQASISGLGSGAYTVTVTDIMGCQGTGSVLVPSLSLPSPQILQHLDTLYCTAPFVSYQWYRNGQAIPYMRDPWIVPDSNGSYDVEVTDTGGCTAISNTLWMTSIQQIGQGHFLDNLILAPNPAQGYVTLVAGDPVRTGVRVGFYDAAGRLVRKLERPELEDEWVIDIHDLGAGLYFLNVSAKNGAYKVLRLLVQN